ncbi:Na+/H+ antiporter NhaC family protein [Halobacillus karajensis]|uniref:Malate-2H(+)/Na(+)-lactate antiporter n=1 Tax=Halobacillus karajensis TaxID=195088 RepID=A0A024PB50_9BACI|nr:Na+/H+ antiporter NhaC family protein [Halobacillus karajensis]CDQ21283.1 Malate-2H(+)/Na(+)-lactate antiporter [Halobacillus karajensis]CDQ25647.1 Malate-2H(+)/Na(+)-lactate antiporter [Halobacillus karajensis]CDQ25918.1 Malate-2H(+)/Na(+)-lactate antiporter [Halobacillus karajensis]
MEGTIYSLIPAVLMLVLVLLTRKVILSLGIGIIIGAFMLTQMDIGAGLALIWSIFANIFVSEGSLNMGSIYLLSFLFLLGVTTAFMTASGGSKAFGRWAVERIRTRKGAGLVPSLLGIVIFIDDYFNALAVGQVARPVTDRHHLSRAKLAYYIDSTSAPITVISPISSWGAYIIGTIGSILAANEITQYQAFEAFVLMIPSNLYVFAALLLVFLTIYLRLDIGPMKVHEQRALETGELNNPEKGDVPGDLNDEFKDHDNGKISHLIWPIVALVAGTVVTMILTGIRNTEGSADILSIFANTNVNISLFIGGVISVLVGFVLYVSQPAPKSGIAVVFGHGLKAMLPAIYILIFAWMIGDIIGQLQTGEFLAQQFSQADFNMAYLPLIIFLLSGFMALSTGTSWGTFGIMLPIAGEIAAVSDPALLLPALSAVLAGSVFGDHCSPISDTTILSSTGAGSNHIDHVMTQLPYALIAAIAASIGYIILGLSGSVWLPLLLTLVIVVVIALSIHKFNPKISSKS